MTSESKIIHLGSGKGGTGKTLIAAILSELLSKTDNKVLVIDGDVFVRGLTTMLYLQKYFSLLDDGKWSVAHFLMSNQNTPLDLQSGTIGTIRYRDFDVVPAVPRIDAALDISDIMPDNFEDACQFMDRLLAPVKDSYDIIIIDNRAGCDEAIAAAHAKSDITLCIEEDDLVAATTTKMLIRQLEEVNNKISTHDEYSADFLNLKGIPIYRIINKSKTSHQYGQGLGLDFLGVIPFDGDIAQAYGNKNFWTTVEQSLAEPFIVQAWNTLCERNDFPTKFRLKSKRRAVFPFRGLEEKTGRLTSRERATFVFGIVIAALGYFITLQSTNFFEIGSLISSGWPTIPLLSLVFGSIGLIGAVTAVLKR